MIIASLVFFALAAIMGLILLTYVITNKTTPKAIAIIHGVFAAVGLILLIIYSFMHLNAALFWMCLFIIVAIVGFYLFSRDITGKPVPKWLAVTHGTIAVLGFITLLIYLVMKIY